MDNWREIDTAVIAFSAGMTKYEEFNLTAKSCLIHHPDTVDNAIKALYIGVKAQYHNGDLQLRYELQGDVDNLLIPEVTSPKEAGELWRHTCFEAFIAVEEEDAYHEFNFSPSGQWAAYAFKEYRQPKPWRAIKAPPIFFARSNGQIVLTSVIVNSSLPENPLNKSYRLGLSAVLETKKGELSYWALCHPAGKPDFHHRSGFTLSFNLPYRA